MSLRSTEIPTPGVASQCEAKSHILYYDITKSHIKLKGTHEHHPHPIPSQENDLLNSSEVNVYKKHRLHY